MRLKVNLGNALQPGKLQTSTFGSHRVSLGSHMVAQAAGTHSEPGGTVASLGSLRLRTIQELDGGEPFRNSMVEDLHHALPVEPSES